MSSQRMRADTLLGAIGYAAGWEDHFGWEGQFGRLRGGHFSGHPTFYTSAHVRSYMSEYNEFYSSKHAYPWCVCLHMCVRACESVCMYVAFSKKVVLL